MEKDYIFEKSIPYTNRTSAEGIRVRATCIEEAEWEAEQLLERGESLLGLRVKDEG